MKIFAKICAVALVSALLASCGGDSENAGTPIFGSGSGSCPTPAASGAASTCSPAATIDVVATSVQAGTGGDTVTISATVKGSNNVGLASVPVGFSVDTGTLTGAVAATDPNGVATAKFSAGADRSNRTATVKVTSGSASGQILIGITGTTLAYTGVTTIPLSGVSTVGVKAVDSKGVVISGLPVTVSSSLNNGLSATATSTDATGNATVTYTATAAGVDTLTFAGAGTSASQAIQVSAANFSFVTPAAGTQVPVTTPQTLTVKYLQGNAPVANQTINFSATAGVVSPLSTQTDAAGMATVSITSSTASPALVQASVAGAHIQATLPLVFTAQAPATLVLQVSPTAIGPNPTGVTTQQAQVLATVTDSNGNPVAGATVAFNRTADPSGGNLSQATAVTDSSGNATVQYISGASSTANNGVQITATVLGTAVAGSTQLTVNQSALFIALGTGNVISNLDPQTYQKDWTVYVTDANGVAVPNVDLTIKVLPLRYGKGHLVFLNSVWQIDAPTYHLCANEDTNYTGNLADGNDLNGDGKLEPGNVISVTTLGGGSNGSIKTDNTGRATITLLYAESYVPWVDVALVAQAIVSGTESSTQAIFTVPGLASDFNSATNPPAGTTSPFGINDCATPN